MRFEWQVSGPRWSGRLAPLLRHSFRRNFDGLMLQGFDGLSQHLAARAREA